MTDETKSSVAQQESPQSTDHGEQVATAAPAAGPNTSPGSIKWIGFDDLNRSLEGKSLWVGGEPDAKLPTPRVDEWIATTPSDQGIEDRYAALWGFARQLERELDSTDARLQAAVALAVEQAAKVCEQSETLSQRRIVFAKEFADYLGAQIRASAPAISAEARRVVEASEKYWELIYAVGNKFKDESRHETALRYIRQAEQHSHVAGDADAAIAAGKKAT